MVVENLGTTMGTVVLGCGDEGGNGSRRVRGE